MPAATARRTPSRKGEASRQAIMDAAQELILESGFAGTSVDAVIARAGATKGGFFHHFDSKAALARALIERDAGRDAARLAANMTRAEALSRDPLQQVLICFGLYEEELAGLTAPYPGCLYASFCYEAQLFDDETMAVVRRAFAEWRAKVGAKIAAIIAHYPPRLPVTPASLADLILAMAEGAYILSKVNRDPKAVAEHFRHYRNYLELLFAPSTAP